MLVMLLFIFTFCVCAYGRMPVDLISTYAIAIYVVSEVLALMVSKFDNALSL